MKKECHHLIQTANYKDEKLQNYSCNSCGKVIQVNPSYRKTPFTIKYYIRDIYGKPTMYISDPSTASVISALSGYRTLVPHVKTALEELGHQFIQILPPKK